MYWVVKGCLRQLECLFFLNVVLIAFFLMYWVKGCLRELKGLQLPIVCKPKP